MNNPNTPSKMSTPPSGESKLPQPSSTSNVNLAAEFSDWLDGELDQLLEDNVKWQTVSGNRLHFGR